MRGILALAAGSHSPFCPNWVDFSACVPPALQNASHFYFHFNEKWLTCDYILWIYYRFALDFFFLLIYFRNCCARLIFNFLPVIFYLFLVYINYQTIMNIRNKLGFFRGISNACLIYLALQFFLKQWLLEQPLCVYANFSSPRVCVGLNFHFLPVLTKCLAYIGA